MRRHRGYLSWLFHSLLYQHILTIQIPINVSKAVVKPSIFWCFTHLYTSNFWWDFGEHPLALPICLLISGRPCRSSRVCPSCRSPAAPWRMRPGSLLTWTVRTYWVLGSDDHLQIIIGIWIKHRFTMVVITVLLSRSILKSIIQPLPFFPDLHFMSGSVEDCPHGWF